MNRTAFSAALSRALTDAGGAPIGVAVINLDRFRRINEHLGSLGGRRRAHQDGGASRGGSIGIFGRGAACGRSIRGLTRLRDGASLQAWGTSLVIALADPVFVEAQPIDITATLGLALASAGAATADELMRCADLHWNTLAARSAPLRCTTRL